MAAQRAAGREMILEEGIEREAASITSIEEGMEAPEIPAEELAQEIVELTDPQPKTSMAEEIVEQPVWTGPFPPSKMAKLIANPYLLEQTLQAEQAGGQPQSDFHTQSMQEMQNPAQDLAPPLEGPSGLPQMPTVNANSYDLKPSGVQLFLDSQGQPFSLNMMAIRNQILTVRNWMTVWNAIKRQADVYDRMAKVAWMFGEWKNGLIQQQQQQQQQGAELQNPPTGLQEETQSLPQQSTPVLPMPQSAVERNPTELPQSNEKHPKEVIDLESLPATPQDALRRVKNPSGVKKMPFRKPPPPTRTSKRGKNVSNKKNSIAIEDDGNEPTEPIPQMQIEDEVIQPRRVESPFNPRPKPVFVNRPTIPQLYSSRPIEKQRSKADYPFTKALRHPDDPQPSEAQDTSRPAASIDKDSLDDIFAASHIFSSPEKQARGSGTNSSPEKKVSSVYISPDSGPKLLPGSQSGSGSDESAKEREKAMMAELLKVDLGGMKDLRAILERASQEPGYIPMPGEEVLEIESFKPPPERKGSGGRVRGERERNPLLRLQPVLVDTAQEREDLQRAIEASFRETGDLLNFDAAEGEMNIEGDDQQQEAWMDTGLRNLRAVEDASGFQRGRPEDFDQDVSEELAFLNPRSDQGYADPLELLRSPQEGTKKMKPNEE